MRKFYLSAFFASLLVGCAYEPTIYEWDEASAEGYCRGPLLTLLREPESYKFSKAIILEQSGSNKEYGKAIISFRSKNGFGGFVPSIAECDRFEKTGKNKTLVKIIEAEEANDLIASYQNKPTIFKVSWDTRDTYTDQLVELETIKPAVCDRPPLGGTKGLGTLKFVKNTETVSVNLEPCVAEPTKEPAVRMPDGRVLYLVESK